MTDENRVVSRCVELAVDGVVQRGVDEDLAALEGENFVDDEVSLEGGGGDWDWIFFGHGVERFPSGAKAPIHAT